MADWEYNTGTPKWGGPSTSGTRQRVRGGGRASDEGSSSGSELSDQKRNKLLERKRRLEALIPVVKAERAARMRRKLDQINNRLGVKPLTIENWVDQGNAKGTDGVGAQTFQVEAPPGIGRLLKLPFYPTALPLDYVVGGGAAVPHCFTAAGDNIPSNRNPLIIMRVPNGTLFSPPIRLTTAQIPWARLRVVGFEVTTVSSASTAQVTPAGGGRPPRPWVLAKDLHVDGSANLFPQHEWMDTAPFNSVTPEFAGLRAYPLLERTKQATVDITVTYDAFAAGVGATISEGLTFSVVLIVEVLEDEQYGSHKVGPYARGASLERSVHKDGDLMVGST